MKAALFAKVKAAGPVHHPQQELARLLLWWPRHLYPVARRLQYWIERFERERGISERQAVESAALSDLEQRLIHAPAGPETELTLRFVRGVARGVKESRAARQNAREGHSVPLDLEEAHAGKLQSWLQWEARLPERMAVASALLRLLRAWMAVRFRSGRLSAGVEQGIRGSR
jgi:hypothetical protein